MPPLPEGTFHSPAGISSTGEVVYFSIEVGFQQFSGETSMAHLKMNKRLVFLSGIIMGYLFSCEMPTEPYFVYISAEIENGIDANKSILLKYSIKNTGDTKISEIEIFCSLIDDIENAYEFSYTDAVSIVQDTVGFVTVDISKQFYYMPKSISIKKFYIKRVLYDDGSVWEDPFGTFAYPY